VASYTSPNVDEILEVAGIDEACEDVDRYQFEGTILALRTRAERLVAIRVGETKFDASDLTAREAGLLLDAVCYRTAARLVSRLLTRKGAGLGGPRFLREADLLAARVNHNDMARELEQLVRGEENPKDRERALAEMHV
jgi:hypothetical protein